MVQGGVRDHGVEAGDERADAQCGDVRYSLSQASNKEAVTAPSVENAPDAKRNL
jgi:hypothetical protein